MIVDITMSLDGFVTAPGDEPGQGLGENGEVLPYWVFGGPWTYAGDRALGEGAFGVDREVLDGALQAEGCAVVGRRMYDITGGWGGTSPFGPCVVVTHRTEDQPDPSTGFEFVIGLEAAIDRAREIAGGGPVGIGGGADVIQQALRAGVVDELNLHVAP